MLSSYMEILNIKSWALLCNILQFKIAIHVARVNVRIIRRLGAQHIQLFKG